LSNCDKRLAEAFIYIQLGNAGPFRADAPAAEAVTVYRSLSRRLITLLLEETILLSIEFAHPAKRSIAVAALIAIVALPVAARGESVTPACDAPFSMIRFTNPLTRVAEQLKKRQADHHCRYRVVINGWIWC
jgi:hypothetical protein